jgi:hypothetical protein
MPAAAASFRVLIRIEWCSSFSASAASVKASFNWPSVSSCAMA